MAFVTVNGVAVSTGTLRLPLVGRGVAELALEADETTFAAGDLVDLVLDGGPTFKMAAAAAGPDRGAYRLRLVGGAGGLAKPLPSRFYGNDAALSMLFKDLLQEAGEAAGDVDLPGTVKFWARRASTAAAALAAVMAQAPDRTWRVQPDGRFRVGTEAWPAGPVVEVLQLDPGNRLAKLTIAPGLLPGVDVAGVGRVVQVVHHIGPQTTEAWTS